MLLRFRVANVRSLRDEQELSFVAPEDAEAERAAARELVLSDGRRLPVHTVLGANASGYRILVAGAEIPVLPPYLLRRRRAGGSATATAARRPASRIRPYLVAHEQRMRRRALVLALDGIDVGPRVIHGHRVGSPVGVPVGVAA